MDNFREQSIKVRKQKALDRFIRATKRLAIAEQFGDKTMITQNEFELARAKIIRYMGYKLVPTPSGSHSHWVKIEGMD